jgi:hypothetical protein
MFGHNIRVKHWLLVGLAAFLALAVVAAVRWRRDVEVAALNPKLPFQVDQPPLAPDYRLRRAWALIPTHPESWTAADPLADVFFVGPTTYDGGRHWNGRIDDPKADQDLTRIMLPNYAGPFQRVGRLFAPRYRQASLYAALSLSDDPREAREFAYRDVKQALDTYLTAFNHGRPLVIAGVEQGAVLVERLAHDALADHPGLADRLAAVYLIDAVALRADYAPQAALPACAAPGQSRCVVGWAQAYEFDQARIRRLLTRSLVWGPDDRLEGRNGRAILCVNPMLGAETDQSASARLNRGAANAAGLSWGQRPVVRPHQVSSRCVGGVLLVSAPQWPALKPAGDWLAQLKAPRYNLFCADIEADAQGRVASLLKSPEFVQPAAPIETSIAVRTVPVHRID